MKKLIFIVLLGLLLSGCATYNAMNDPVYQAYQRGEISYADYVAHYDNMMMAQQAQRQSIAQAFKQAGDDMKRRSDQRRQESYQERQAEALEGIDRKLRYGY